MIVEKILLNYDKYFSTNFSIERKKALLDNLRRGNEEVGNWYVIFLC